MSVGTVLIAGTIPLEVKTAKPSSRCGRDEDYNSQSEVEHAWTLLQGKAGRANTEDRSFKAGETSEF